jgi:predicted nucleic-acid-binding protein
MESIIDQFVLEKAIEKWGIDAQLYKLEEELVELLLVLKHMNKDETDERVNDVVDEIADVYILIYQSFNIFDRKKIAERIVFKQNRLDKRISTE